MCDSCDSGWAAEFSSSIWRKARKPHGCDECGRTIQPGERYERQSGKFEGHMFANDICARCSRMWSCHYEATRAAREDCSPPLGELLHSIAECSRENPAYRAAFAKAWKAAA